MIVCVIMRTCYTFMRWMQFLFLFSSREVEHSLVLWKVLCSRLHIKIDAIASLRRITIFKSHPVGSIANIQIISRMASFFVGVCHFVIILKMLKVKIHRLVFEPVLLYIYIYISGLNFLDYLSMHKSRRYIVWRGNRPSYYYLTFYIFFILQIPTNLLKECRSLQNISLHSNPISMEQFQQVNRNFFEHW